MKKCYILNSKKFSDIYDKNIDLRFKFQGIFDAKKIFKHKYTNCMLGSEILVDFSKSAHLGTSEEALDTLILLGNAANKSLDYASTFIKSSLLFVNMERSNLCDIKVLKRIIDISKKLASLGVELVIEITERDFCSSCTRVIEGLSYLKMEKVSLARDDFDYMNLDFKSAGSELKLYYDYVKVEMPLNKAEYSYFNDFLATHYQSKKIVIERIENKTQLKSLDIDKIWGLQGFLFCRGIPLPTIRDKNHIKR